MVRAFRQPSLIASRVTGDVVVKPGPIRMDHEARDSGSDRANDQRDGSLLQGRSTACLSAIPQIGRNRTSGAITFEWISTRQCPVELTTGAVGIVNLIWPRTEISGLKRIDWRGVAESGQNTRAQTSPVKVREEEGLVVSVVHMRDYDRAA